MASQRGRFLELQYFNSEIESRRIVDFSHLWWGLSEPHCINIFHLFPNTLTGHTSAFKKVSLFPFPGMSSQLSGSVSWAVNPKWISNWVSPSRGLHGDPVWASRVCCGQPNPGYLSGMLPRLVQLTSARLTLAKRLGSAISAGACACTQTCSDAATGHRVWRARSSFALSKWQQEGQWENREWWEQWTCWLPPWGLNRNSDNS